MTVTSLARDVDHPIARIVRPEIEAGSGSITSRFGSPQAPLARLGVKACLAMYSPRCVQSIPSNMSLMYYIRITLAWSSGERRTMGVTRVLPDRQGDSLSSAVG
jgi:hypothetical protein